MIAAVVTAVWWTGAARGTTSRPAQRPAPSLPTATAVPAQWTTRWEAASARTAAPVVVAGSVVTADGRTVRGHDPRTGVVTWTYARDRDLCGVLGIRDDVVAVYRDRRGCGQVTSLHGADGRRAWARTADADPSVALSTDDTTVLSAGDSRLELWRSDLVRSLSYGRLDAPVNPTADGARPCRFLSSAASSVLVAVIEACPDEPEIRLALLRPADDETAPDRTVIAQPGIGPDAGAAVIAVADTRTALYLPTPAPHVVVVDETGTVIADTSMAAAASSAGPATRAGDLVTWFTGSEVMVFDGLLEHRYTVAPSPGSRPVGPGTLYAGRLLIPVTGGLAVLAPRSGAVERVMAVARAGTAPDATVVPAAAGDLLVEQRGPTLAVLGPA